MPLFTLVKLNPHICSAAEITGCNLKINNVAVVRDQCTSKTTGSHIQLHTSLKKKVNFPPLQFVASVCVSDEGRVLVGELFSR